MLIFDLVRYLLQHFTYRFAGLEESRDELQAAVALQAGRELLMLNPCNNNADKGPSLAVELLAGMNPDQVFSKRWYHYDRWSCKRSN